jgi:hypothetical protein
LADSAVDIDMDQRPGLMDQRIDRDDDIEFDFFEDEPPTREEPAPRRRLPGGNGPRGPRRRLRAPTGLTPLLRLIGLIAFAIFIVVVLVLWVQGCRDSAKTTKYKNYMGKVTDIAKASEQNGRSLNEKLTTPGIKQDDLVSAIRGIAASEQQNVAAAEKLNPPGRLREEHHSMIESLQFRVSGLEGLADTFQKATNKANEDSDALLLSSQAQRLVASDVVWDDLFKDPSVVVLQQQGITGVAVPDSNFVTNPDLASVRSMGPVLQRIHGASTSGTPTGLHGTNIVSTKALPTGQELSTETENIIKATSDLGFEVAVKDSGDSQEVHIEVTLTIQKSPTPIVQTKTIDLINANEVKTVTFTDLGQVPFVQKTSVKVDVKPVPGEKNTGNNSAQYPVLFSLP